MRELISRLLTGKKPAPVAPIRQPARIHLVRDRDLEWSDRRQVAALVGDLRAVGFQTITSFRIEEIPELRLVGLAHPEAGHLGVVYEHRLAGAWCNLVAIYRDGKSLTVSNARQSSKLEPRPGHEKHLLPGASVAKLYRTFQRRLRDEPRSRVEPGNFVLIFEDAYAEEIAWRQRSSAPDPATASVRDPRLDRECEPLFAAIQALDEIRMREFLGRGLSPEGRDAHGRTALMAAAATGEPALVEALLQAGAEVSARAVGLPGDALASDPSGHPEPTGILTPLTSAIESGNAEVVRRLIAAGAQLEGPGELTPLQFAAQQGDAEVAQALIAAGADANRRGEDDMTPLLAAASEGYLDVVEILVGAGADVEVRCGGETAISLAAAAGARDVVAHLAPRLKGRLRKQAEKILAEATGPVPDTRVRRLMVAAMNGKAAMVRKLLAAGVAPDAVEHGDASPVTPLMAATQEGDLEIMRLLIAAGADVNHSEGQDTPLKRALNPTFMDAEKQPAVIRLLVDSGAFTFDLSEQERALVARATKPQSSSWSA